MCVCVILGIHTCRALQDSFPCTQTHAQPRNLTNTHTHAHTHTHTHHTCRALEDSASCREKSTRGLARASSLILASPVPSADACSAACAIGTRVAPPLYVCNAYHEGGLGCQKKKSAEKAGENAGTRAACPVAVNISFTSFTLLAAVASLSNAR